MRAKLVVTVALSSIALAGCGTTAASGTPQTKSEICAQALGSAALGEISDAAQRDAQRAKELADLLQKLSTQTQDQQLAKALTDTAQTAGQAAVQHLTDGDLVKWVQQKADRINNLRKICTS